MNRHGLRSVAVGDDSPSWLHKFVAMALSFVDKEREELPLELLSAHGLRTAGEVEGGGGGGGGGGGSSSMVVPSAPAPSLSSTALFQMGLPAKKSAGSGGKRQAPPNLAHNLALQAALRQQSPPAAAARGSHPGGSGTGLVVPKEKAAIWTDSERAALMRCVSSLLRVFSSSSAFPALTSSLLNQAFRSIDRLHRHSG